MPAESTLEAFLTRWTNASGGELANYGLFLTELCAALELPSPEPASEDTRDNAYVFQRRVIFQHGDGEESSGFIDTKTTAATPKSVIETCRARLKKYASI